MQHNQSCDISDNHRRSHREGCCDSQQFAQHLIFLPFFVRTCNFKTCNCCPEEVHKHQHPITTNITLSGCQRIREMIDLSFSCFQGPDVPDETATSADPETPASEPAPSNSAVSSLTSTCTFKLTSHCLIPTWWAQSPGRSVHFYISIHTGFLVP